MGEESDAAHLSLVKPVTGYTSISSDGNYRYFSVIGGILNTHNVTKVSNEINDLVNDNMIDLDSLDEDVKMSVVKFKKEKP